MSFLYLVRWTPLNSSLQVRLTFFYRSVGRADLWSDVLPISESSVQVDIFVRSSGQPDLWSAIAPISEASDKVDIFARSSGQADLWSDILPTKTSCGQVCYYFDQVGLWWDVSPSDILWPSVTLLHLYVRLTFGQMYPHRQRHLVAKSDITPCQVDLFIGG